MGVNLPRRVLQRRHAAAVVLDQVVIGGKKTDHALLCCDIRPDDLQFVQSIAIDARD